MGSATDAAQERGPPRHRSGIAPRSAEAGAPTWACSSRDGVAQDLDDAPRSVLGAETVIAPLITDRCRRDVS